MAADTREQESPTSLKAAPHSAPRKSEEACAVPLSPPNANALPAGAGLNTAGGKGKEASYLDALKSVQLNELQEVHKKPCVRDAFLTGIGSGFGIGGVRAITGASMWMSCNWAVGSFMFSSLMMHEYCKRKRQLEIQGMQRAVEVIDRKQAEKKKKAEEARAARSKAKEES